MKDLRVSQLALAVIFASILIGVPMADSKTDAWELGGHSAITQQAVNVLPKPLKQELEAHLNKLITGVLEPDRNRVESHKTYVYAIRGRTAQGSGGAHFALDRFGKQAEEMIKAGESMGNVAFVLGQAAHFIQDLNVPLHTITGETDAEHKSYERQAFFTEWPGPGHGYRGFFLVKKYQCFAFETAKRSNRYVDAALSTNPPRDVIETTWDDAVNDTANLWQSIFYRALGADKSQELYGIPAPKGEVGKGWFC